MAKKDTLLPWLVSEELLENNTGGSDDSRDELGLKILDEVYSTKDIDVKTDLTANQIVVFTRAEMYHEKYQSPLVDLLLKRMSIRLVSKDRKGRKEFTEIAKALNTMLGGDPMATPSLSDRFFGKEKL